MGKENETTAKFKVDISELTQGIQAAKRQIALANATFKSATAGMDDWAKSATGISNKLTQLKGVLSGQTKILNSLEEQYRLTAQEMGADSKAAENLKIKIENQKAAIAKTEKEIGKYETALSDVKSESKQSESAIGQLTRTIREQESELNSLKSAYSNAVLEYGKNSKEAKELSGQIDKLSGDLSDNKSKLDAASSAADDLDRSLVDAGDAAEQAEGGFTILKGTLASLAAEGIKACATGLSNLAKELVTDSSSAYTQFAAATGTATDAMGEYDDAIKSVYKNNFGESLADVADKMAKVKEVTGELDASKLQSMTEKAITLEDVFGMDMTETLRGVNSLMDHFGLTSEEAFDLISSGAQNGLNYTDELGDNVSEYAGKFAEAGYSSKEYFQLLKNGADGGAYNLDKVNDAVNEVTTRLADGTIEDSLLQFSTKTQEVFTAWQNGEATQKDVITSIVSDIQGVTNEQEKMNLAALAFGTMAEDGGTKFIEALTPVGDTFDDVKGKADELAAIKYDTPQAAIQGIGRTLKTDLLGPLADALLPVLNNIAAWVTANLPGFVDKIKDLASKAKDVVANLKEWTPLLAGIGAAIATYFAVGKISAFVGWIKSGAAALKMMEIAQAALNVVMNLNPIGIIIGLISGLVAAFVVLWNKSEAFRNFWKGLWENCKNIVSDVVDAIKGFFEKIGNFFKENWQTILTFIINPFAGAFKVLYEKCEGFRNFVDKIVSAIKDFFVNLGTSIAQGASNLWNNIVEIFTPVVEWFSNLFSSVYNTLKSVVTVIIGLLKGCWTAIKRVFEVVSGWFNENVIQPVSNFFKDLWDKISSGAKAAWSAISGAFKAAASWFNDTVIKPVSDFFKGMWDKLKSGAKGAWDGIKNVFSNVTSWFKDKFTQAWTAVKNVFSTGGKIFSGIKEGIENTFKTVVNGIIKGINTIISKPFGAINNMLNKIRNASFLGVSPFKNMWGQDPLSVPQIPLLYKGGVLKKGQLGLLEGKGTEAVVPLENNKKWINKTAKDLKASLQNEGVIGQAKTVSNAVTNNYSFVQNNTSPKALSRLDIYRQTKNQLAFAKGV